MNSRVSPPTETTSNMHVPFDIQSSISVYVYANVYWNIYTTDLKDEHANFHKE